MIVVGCCFGLKCKGFDVFVYMLFLDGELDEGVVWEGLLFVVYWKLDNFIVVVDVNN